MRSLPSVGSCPLGFHSSGNDCLSSPTNNGETIRKTSGGEIRIQPPLLAVFQIGGAAVARISDQGRRPIAGDGRNPYGCDDSWRIEEE